MSRRYGRIMVRKYFPVLPITIFSRWMLLLALLLPASVLAADFSCTPAPPSNIPSPGTHLEKLEDVIVTGKKARSRVKDLNAWLKLLEGQYRYEGHVDLCGNGDSSDQRPITGKADCVGLSDDPSNTPPRSLYCVVDIRWSQTENDGDMPATELGSHLSPATIVYGVVPELPGIQFMQMDDRGMITHAKGRLIGDTLTTTEPCGQSDFCQKMTQITARSGARDVVVLIDFTINNQRVLHQEFVLHRVSNNPIRRTANGSLELKDLQSVGHR